MVVHLYTICWNEALLLPYFLQHYEALADHIVVMDNASDDGTAEIAQRHPKVDLRTWHSNGQIRDDLYLEMKHRYVESRGVADWVIVVDMDEFLWHPLGVRRVLAAYQQAGITFPRVEGIGLISEGPVPPFDGKTALLDRVTRGYRDPDYSKRCVFHPAIDIHYGPGCHKCAPAGQVVESPAAELKLLHLRDLGVERQVERFRRLEARRSAVNRAKNWGNLYGVPEAELRRQYARRRQMARPLAVLWAEDPLNAPGPAVRLAPPAPAALQRGVATALQAARAHHKAGRLSEAEALYRTLLQQTPAPPQALGLLGFLVHQAGDSQSGLEHLDRALAHQPAAPSLHNNRGVVLQALDRGVEAEGAYREALRLRPRYAGACYNLAGLYAGRGDLALALAHYDRVLLHQPGHLDALLGRGTTLQRMGRLEEAEACFREALRQAPTNATAHLDLGNLLRVQGRLGEALACYREAVRHQPGSALAYSNLGAALQVQGRLDKAVWCFRNALTLEPDQPQALYNLGLALDAQSHFEAARDAYARVVELGKANALPARCYLELVRMKLADWTDHTGRCASLVEALQAHLENPDAEPVPPFTLNVFDVPAPLRAAAARHQARLIERNSAPLRQRCAFVHPSGAAERLRVGYVSPDFRTHAVGTLVHQLFAHHDRAAVAVYGYGLVPSDDAYARHVRAGCDVFVDASQMTPEETARRIHADGIHVLVDMGGYTTFTRTDLFALRPAPVQLHWLGYLDTMGADFLPYVLADRRVMTEEMARHYSEAVVYLPDGFVAASPLEIAETPSTRAEVGLPEEAFVFCCFNTFHKIDPAVFDVWMDVLQQTPGSVLWLYEGDTETGRENLRREAARRGVAPARLVFAARRSMPEYLAQHRLADLFLDAFVYNAGTTAACALQAGLPVLTLPGTTFLSRMGASLVAAAGLPELSCGTPEEYAARALHLATHPAEVAALKHRLAAQRPTAPLFDLPHFARTLERAYRRLWQDHRDGHSPRSFDVPPA